MSDAAMIEPQLQPHPLADLFPLMEGEPFRELVEDIRQHGVREPITLLDGMILDGRNRYRAALEAGVEPRFTTYQGDDPEAFVDSANLHRRHLTESQRAMRAAKIANAKEGRRSSTTSPDVVTQAQAAEMHGVGVASVQRAAEVLKHGDPDLVADVEAGKVSVNAAAKIARKAKKPRNGRVALHPQTVKQRREDGAAIIDAVNRVAHVASVEWLTPEKFFEKIDALLAWKRRPDPDNGPDFRAQASRQLAYLDRHLDTAVVRLAALQAAYAAWKAEDEPPIPAADSDPQAAPPSDASDIPGSAHQGGR